ncbi:hypothetical protein [Methylocella silvestris]|uniref:Uncharacterized protein n=1 Tax=Methylocella silvestris TaxID=199596 RepID=A0A2J7TD91_METSI|nr:hypothetical protein [Methylocella silvestris]PNG24728.1 hypothetical protein CR492_17150 [Methylocella silvestris]
MKSTISAALAAFIVMGAIIATVEEAGAVVCARGVYRAGCATTRGAAVVRRPPVAVHRRAVIVR